MLPRWLNGKESACQAGDMGWIPGWRRFPREGNGSPLQYSCLGNPMERGAWQATVHVVARVWHHLVTKPQPLRYTGVKLKICSRAKQKEIKQTRQDLDNCAKAPLWGAMRVLCSIFTFENVWIFSLKILKRFFFKRDNVWESGIGINRFSPSSRCKTRGWKRKSPGVLLKNTLLGLAHLRNCQNCPQSSVCRPRPTRDTTLESRGKKLKLAI